MKTLNLILALVSALAANSLAQEKLWTWRPTTPAYYRTLHAVSMKKDGSAAFVIGQSKAAATAKSLDCWYSVHWINAHGKVIMEKRIETRDRDSLVLMWEGGPRWEVAFAGDHVMVSDGSAIRIYSQKNGEVKMKKLPADGDTNLIFFGGSGFGGWLANNRVQKGLVAGAGKNGEDAPGWDIESLVAWK